MERLTLERTLSTCSFHLSFSSKCTPRYFVDADRNTVAGIFRQTSVIYFCRGFSGCLYYRDVRNSGVSARRKLTVLAKFALLMCVLNWETPRAWQCT